MSSSIAIFEERTSLGTVKNSSMNDVTKDIMSRAETRTLD